MNLGNRRLLFVIGGLALALTAAFVSLGAQVSHSGVLVVEVKDCGGTDIRVRIPAAVVQVLLPLVPRIVFEEAGNEEWTRWSPIVHRILSDADSTPDFVAIDCRGPLERVRISKEKGRIVLHVDSMSERVRIEIPMGLAFSVLRTVERVSATRPAGTVASCAA